MTNVDSNIYDLKLLDEMAQKNTPIHRLHPLVKCIATMSFLVVLASFDRHEISRLFLMALFPFYLLVFGELSIRHFFKRLLVVEPLILGIGILNPFFDSHQMMIGTWSISMGWLTFVSIAIKGTISVLVSLILIGTTGIDRLAEALRMLKVPKIFVLQLLLTYRYIGVLMEELSSMLRAYSLRAPGQKGIEFKAMGSFAGQLLLRTYDRAQRIFVAMKVRGFEGEYYVGSTARMNRKDYQFLIVWSVFFVVTRWVPLPW
jgi:cobalt/nickel transport system permease protein